MPYESTFITGCDLPLPNLSQSLTSLSFSGGAPVDHERFSILFHQGRGFAVATAHNIDGASILAAGAIERRDRFRFDPDVPNHMQVDNDRGYRNNPWDRGHLVRRRALHWGDFDAAVEADRQSFYWTNIAPQHERLHDTAWGAIEDWMLELADDGDKRASVFTGPILTGEDPMLVNDCGEVPVQLPAGFWKVIAIKHQEQLRAAGFLVWQRDFDKAVPVDFDPMLEQVRLTTIEYLTGMTFGALRDADPLQFGNTFEADGVAISSSAPLRSTAITCAADIALQMN